MKILRNSCLPIVVLIALGMHGVAAQEVEEAAVPEVPVLESLGSNWWAYFEGTPGEVKQRADGFVEALSEQVGNLEAANQPTALSVLAALTDNLDAYVALLDDPVLGLEELPSPALSYSLDDLLEHASRARSARAGAEQESVEVEREQRILNGATRRRDQAFKDYVASDAGDARWLAGLRLVQVRAAQAIASRRVELLTQSYEQAEAYSRSAAQRVNEARERLESTDADASYVALVDSLAGAGRAVAEAQESLREAEIAATGLDLDTPGGRSQQRLQQQRTIDAEVELAQAEVSLGQLQARRWWTALQLGSVNDLDLLQAEALEWSELERRVEQSLPDWQQQSREELIAVQTMERDGLNRASRRLLDQRVGTAQETLSHLSTLSASAEDLQLLSLVVDDAVADTSGAVSSWWGGLKRKVQSAYLRVSGLADVSLFSVGETPVTGNDIMRVLIILLVAWLLSRGARLAFRRMSQRESPSMQASMYTVGRLTHYAIIILAVFIALSSIGLDFSNLALVAGALSVGIGFGLQSIVSNFVSGLIILFEHTLRVGDYIELDTGLTGTVKSINVRSTLINTNDNIDIVVPNSEFVTTRLTNWTLGERILRVRIPFGVAYGSDKELVKKAAIEAADEVPYTLTHMRGREPDVWLVEYGDNSLNFLLLVWVNRQGARRPTRTRAAYLWALETKLTEHGIEIPFPQRDLHLRSGWPEPAVPGDAGKDSV